MFARLLETLFPPECAACGRPGFPFCTGCVRSIVRLPAPGCQRCGRPLDASPPTCRDCPPAPIAWSRAPFLFDGPARAALHRLKFSGQRSLAAGLAPAMVEALARSPPPALDPRDLGDRVITWVPLGARRRRRRGFDQAEALARPVAALLGWPVRPLLHRAVETAPQARRSGPERRRALEGAFRARGPVPAAVVLVDDVLTSGATAAACASVLVAAGCREVGVLTAARALNGRLPLRCYTPASVGPVGWDPPASRG